MPGPIDYPPTATTRQMPATTDAAVIAWRRWLDRFGSGLPTLPKSAADLPPANRMQVFDRCASKVARARRRVYAACTPKIVYWKC